jgi:hypothetical protein
MFIGRCVATGLRSLHNLRLALMRLNMQLQGKKSSKIATMIILQQTSFE